MIDKSTNSTIAIKCIITYTNSKVATATVTATITATTASSRFTFHVINIHQIRLRHDPVGGVTSFPC